MRSITFLPAAIAVSVTIVLAQPPAPTLNLPADAATGIALNPTLTWNTVPGAVTYRVQLSTVSTFATTVVDDSSLTAGSRAVTGLANSTMYFWRVNATNAGGTSAWSSIWVFTTSPLSSVVPYQSMTPIQPLRKITVYDLSGRVVSRTAEVRKYHAATSGYYIYKTGDQARKARSVR